MMIRNGADLLDRALRSMAQYCDAVYVLEDRSTDETRAILARHPVVANVFHVDPKISPENWFFSESAHLELLYRMADYYLPDWIVLVEHDELLTPESQVRSVLSDVPRDVPGVRIPRLSSWDDPEYPLMVPLMNGGRSLQGGAWRHFPGLRAGTKPLHNGRMPANLSDHGGLVDASALTLHHSGWSTLRKRIERARFYFSRDPEAAWNQGVPYDRGLLFGYSLDEIDQLIAEYQVRHARDVRGGS